MLRKLLILTSILLPIPLSTALAYEDKTTHPALTSEVVRYLNLSGPNISDEERSWLIEGSRDEDAPPRWINHFYDPIHNTGWTGARAGNIPQSAVQIFSRLGLSTEKPLSALDWSTNYGVQEEYSVYGGNRTWQRAIEYYLDGNKKEAWITLGHILHLAQDMAVPDHTRDDTHARAPGDDSSPYEQYADQYDPSSIKVLKLPEELRSKNFQVPPKSSIRDYLSSLAEYSNRYFFSKDTINDSAFLNPKIVKESEGFTYGKDENDSLMPLAGIDYIKTSDKSTIKIFSLANKEEYYPILNSYFTHLAKRSILTGAGIIGLFKAQVADAEVNQEFQVDTRHTLGRVSRNLGHIASLPSLSFIGILAGIRNGVYSSLGEALTTLQTAWSYVGGTQVPNSTNIEILGSGQGEKGQDVALSQEIPENSLVSRTIPSTDPPLGAPVVTSTTKPLPPPPPPITPRPTSSKTLALIPKIPTLPTSTLPLPPPPPITLVFGGGASGSQAPAVAIATSAPPSNSRNILISEILFDADGSDEGKEFIELYNPNEEPQDLDDYTLRYSTSNSTSTHTLASIRTSSSTKTIIPPKGFWLAGFSNYDSKNYGGLEADLSRAVSLPNALEDAVVKIYLSNKNGEEINSATYIKATLPSPGYSLERSAWKEGCMAAEGAGEFLGNGCDNGDAFFARKTPRPQSSQSLPEPRNPPSPPRRADGGSLASFKGNMIIGMGWDYSADFRGNTSTVIYSISTAQNFLATTSATTTSIRAREAPQDYEYWISAVDQDGLASATTSAIASIPALTDRVYFYKNPKSSVGSPAFFVEFRYSSRPFIPQITSNGLGWQAMLAYRNHDPDPENDLLKSSNSYRPQKADAAVCMTNNCSALFGLTASDSSGVGGGLYNSTFLLPEEDGRLTLKLDIQEATSSDFLRIGYYDVQNGGGMTNDHDFGLIAVDSRKIYYSETPPDQTPPTAPLIISDEFDPVSVKMKLSWSTSTDSDSPDAYIIYDINYSTTTELASSSWISVGKDTSAEIPLTFGTPYIFGVRAVDDLGTASEPAILNWNFPSEFQPAEPFIGYFNSAYCKSGPQQFKPPADIKINSVEFNSICANGSCDPPNRFLIYDETGSNLLASSNGNSSRFGYPDFAALKQLFEGPDQIILYASSTYGIIPRSENGDCMVGGNSEQSKFVMKGVRPS